MLITIEIPLNTVFHRRHRKQVKRHQANIATTMTELARILPASLTAPEQELHVLWRELLHSDLVVIDSAIDHVSFLLL